MPLTDGWPHLSKATDLNVSLTHLGICLRILDYFSRFFVNLSNIFVTNIQPVGFKVVDKS